MQPAGIFGRDFDDGVADVCSPDIDMDAVKKAPFFERGSGSSGDDVGSAVPSSAKVRVDVGGKEHRHVVAVEQIVEFLGCFEVVEAVALPVCSFAGIVEGDMEEDEAVLATL